MLMKYKGMSSLFFLKGHYFHFSWPFPLKHSQVSHRIYTNAPLGVFQQPVKTWELEDYVKPFTQRWSERPKRSIFQEKEGEIIASLGLFCVFLQRQSRTTPCYPSLLFLLFLPLLSLIKKKNQPAPVWAFLNTSRGISESHVPLI